MADASRIEHLRGLESHLRGRIRGQDHVLPRVAAAFARGALGVAVPDRPRSSFLFVGPSGTGKTETFTVAANYVFGPGHLVIFDMSEYQAPTAVNKLLGEHRGDPGLLGRALRASTSGCLLFDEVEKAHPLVMDLFLQILWNARITCTTGEKFQLGDIFIGFTSNIGAVEAMRMEHSKPSSIEQAILRRVEQTLRPELLGRIAEKLAFLRLTPAVQEEICALEVARETARLRGVGYDLSISKEALEFLVRAGFHPTLGARPLRQCVEHQIQDAVVRNLFASGIGAGRLVPDSASSSLVLAHN